MRRVLVAMLITGFAVCLGGAKKPPDPTPLDDYIRDALQRAPMNQSENPGSIYAQGNFLADVAGDNLARQVDDVVTIVVYDRASGVATGSSKASRKSSVQSTITAIAGPTNPGAALANLAALKTQSELDGQGQTQRFNTLTTNLTGRVVQVLPNGFLVVEAVKAVVINSEQQLVSVRGVVRPIDLSAGNAIRSDQVAMLEVRLNGKGVVNDAIRRPFFLSRLLLGILPF